MDDRQFELSGPTGGHFDFQTNCTSGERSLVFSLDFLKSATPENVLTVIDWAVNHWDEFIEDCRAHPLAKEPQKQIPEPVAMPPDYRGVVYLLKCGDTFKIGRARDINARIMQISPVMPYPVELIHTIATENTFEVEGWLHRHFSTQRLNGEWFDLSSKDVEFIKTLGLP